MDFKPQDLLFIIVFLLLLIKRDPKFFVIAGLSCLVLSIPLFAQWIFFTAQRLVWFSFVFFVIAVLLSIIKDSRFKHGK